MRQYLSAIEINTPRLVCLARMNAHESFGNYSGIVAKCGTSHSSLHPDLGGALAVAATVSWSFGWSDWAEARTGEPGKAEAPLNIAAELRVCLRSAIPKPRSS